MKIDKAKRIVRLEDALEFCKKQSMLEQYVSNEEWKHYSIAVDAIEKQIPQRPIEDGYYGEPAVCPNCGGNVINQCDNDYQFQCCHYCGQKLDWSDPPTEKGGEQE